MTAVNLARLAIGILLSVALAVMSATGFAYTTAISVVISFITSAFLFVSPFVFGFSGRPSVLLLFFSVAVASVLLIAMLLNFAALNTGSGEFWAAVRNVVSDAGLTGPLLVSGLTILIGSFLIGLVLPPRYDAARR